MYKVILVDNDYKVHTVNGHPVEVRTSDLEYAVSQIMRNRDPKSFDILIKFS
jgi:hypothetical protein